MEENHRPDLTDTDPVVVVEPQPSWFEPGRIVSLDPYGHLTSETFAEQIGEGWDIRPTIAVTMFDGT